MLLIAATTLAGCNYDPNRFAPACPRASILADAGDITRFAANGHDVRDMVFDARITGLPGKCGRRGDTIVVTSIKVGLHVTRGPAAPQRVVDVPYFVAVTENGAILNKKVFTERVKFPDNVDQVDVSGKPVDLALPVTSVKSAAVYAVLVGFQLTPAELATNRLRGPR